MTTDPVISLDDIKVHFTNDSLFGGEATTVKAVDGVSLDIGQNDVVALVGESGCGKTTLGKVAVGLQRPTRGTVEYRGQDIWDAKDGTGEVNIAYKKIRRALQIIHQDPGSSLNPNRTVLANLSVPLKKYRPDLNVEERRTVVHRLLERVGVTPPENYSDRFPHQLSGGEQQRVVLCRTLLMQPDVILADEAVSALDVSLRIEMMDLMLELQDLFDTSYLFVSHDLSNANYLTKKAGGRIAIMYLGKIVEIGPPEEILYDPKHPYTKTLVWSSPTIDPAKARAESMEEPPVRTIDIPTPEDKPSGCSFHTRCPKIIPPDEMSIDQRAYNEIMDLRRDLEDEELQLDQFKTGQSADGEDSFSIQRFREVYFDCALPDEHRRQVETALEPLQNGDGSEHWEAAAERLRNQYESVCERRTPEIDEESNSAACFLETADPATESSS